MTFNFSDYKLRSGDLSYRFVEEIEGALRDGIKDNEDLMKEVKVFCEEEAKENPESTLTMEDRIMLKIDEMAENAVSGIRIYCEFDLEVEL